MKLFLSFLAFGLFICSVLTSAPAVAWPQDRPDDMMLDQHWYYPRPWVPSDGWPQRDMLSEVPLMLPSKEDAFPKLPVFAANMPQDMFTDRPLPDAPMVEILVIDR